MDLRAGFTPHRLNISTEVKEKCGDAAAPGFEDGKSECTPHQAFERGMLEWKGTRKLRSAITTPRTRILSVYVLDLQGFSRLFPMKSEFVVGSSDHPVRQEILRSALEPYAHVPGSLGQTLGANTLDLSLFWAAGNKTIFWQSIII